MTEETVCMTSPRVMVRTSYVGADRRSGITGTGVFLCFFFFQAEDGIRDYKVTGVQTCALPIWDVDLVVLGAIADLVHHEAELANADVLEVLAILVEDLHMRSGHRVLDPLPRVLVLERTEEVSGDRDPDVAFAVHGGGAGRIEPGDEDLGLVSLGHDELAGLRLQGGARHPPARRARSCVLRQRHGDQRQGGEGRQDETPEYFHRHSSSNGRGTAT